MQLATRFCLVLAFACASFAAAADLPAARSGNTAAETAGGWMKCQDNPVLGGKHDACYKPYAVFDGRKRLLWYNGRHGGFEQIGLVAHEGEDLGFDPPARRLSSAISGSVKGDSARLPLSKDKAAPVVKFQAEPFPLAEVRLLQGPFQHAMQLDRQYLLSLDADRLLHVFRLSAGLPSAARPYGGWMAPKHNSRGEFVGLYLSACAEMYASTADEQVKRKGNQVVAGLAQCQQKFGNGFLHTHPDTFTSRCEAPVPFWYQVHKILAGLMDMYVMCDDRQALDVAIKLADWADRASARFSDAQVQKMLAQEHGGINEALANLYALTGQPKYLQLAMRFNHRAVLGPASERQDRLTGLHANTQIPKFVGAARQYELTGQSSLRTAASFFWETVVRERSYIIGGHSLNEHFTPKETLSRALGWNTCETCNTYNMLKLTRHLFSWDPRAEYADYYERALYNHILASQNPATGMMCYFLPLGSDAKCRKTYCTPEDSFWCCTGTGIENHAKYGDSIYFHQGQAALYVNLFIASELDWPAKGLRLRQETNYPDEGATRLLLFCEKPLRLDLRIRHPHWAKSGFEIRVNGLKQSDSTVPGSYATVAREWSNGDTVEVAMPFTLHTESFRDNPQRVAFLHGPLVLCAENDATAVKPPYPAIAAGEGRLFAELKPVPGKPSTFTAPARVLRLSGEFNAPAVTLQPLYRFHDHHGYVVYWDIVTPKRGSKSCEGTAPPRTIPTSLPSFPSFPPCCPFSLAPSSAGVSPSVRESEAP